MPKGASYRTETWTAKALSIVLGSLSASTLFPDQDPLGRSVRLSLGGGRITFNFRVIGVMEQEGNGGESETHDNSVFIPVSTLQSRIGRFRSSSGDVNVTQISIQTGRTPTRSSSRRR